MSESSLIQSIVNKIGKQIRIYNQLCHSNFYDNEESSKGIFLKKEFIRLFLYLFASCICHMDSLGCKLILYI